MSDVELSLQNHHARRLRATAERLYKAVFYGESNVCEEAADEIDRLSAELAVARAWILALESQHRWRSVESAPKDGSEILGFRADAGVLLVKWDAPINFCTDYELRNLDEASAEQYDWFCADFMTSSRLEGDEAPTHWMPLPALPPAETPEAKE